MRKVIKGALAVGLCLAFLVPSAWGRTKYYRSAHPKGDSPHGAIKASAPSVRLIFTRVWTGVWMPTYWVYTKSAERVPTRVTTPKQSVAKKKGVNR